MGAPIDERLAKVIKEVRGSAKKLDALSNDKFLTSREGKLLDDAFLGLNRALKKMDDALDSLEEE